MDPQLRKLASQQYDVVAAWQLRGLGLTSRMVEHRVQRHGWRVIHRGVYAVNHAPLTRHQLWMAASLTSPNSYLSHASAGALYGFRPWQGRFETITRPGRRGRRRHGTVLVSWSPTLDGDVTRHQGIPITTAARAFLDLAALLPEKGTRRCFREALRLK